MEHKNRTIRQKNIVFLLTASLIFGLFSFTSFAETDDSPNLIRNGGFENSATMKEDWNLVTGVPNELKLEDGTVYAISEITNDMAASEGGNGYAAKLIKKNKENDFYIRQNVFAKDGIVPGVTYKFSYRIYADELEESTDAGVGAYLTYYPGGDSMTEGTHLATHKIVYSDSTTNGRWTEVSGEFVFPSDAKSLRILMRCRAVGTVYFDDISLKAVKARKFEYYTSHVFHYSEEKQGSAKVSILPYYQSGINKLDETILHVNLGIYDEGKYIFGQNDVPFTNFEAICTYPVDALTILQKQYTLKISVLDAQNTVLDAYTQSLYKYERPKFLDMDGNFRGVDGKIVPPVIAFHLNENYFEKASDAGFTMYQMPYKSALPENKESTKKLLDAGQKEGLYGLFSLYVDMKAAAHPDNIEYTKEIVNIFKEDRRFLGWIVQDEPLGGGITEEAKALLELSYKTIRGIDPNHPIILTDYNRNAFKETIKYCDIFIPNAYGGGYNGVRSYVEEAAKYAPSKPIYPNIKAYAKSLETLPSGMEVKHQIHQAFLAGAKGVSVYAFNDSVNNGEEGQDQIKIPIFKTPIWDSLVETGTKEIPVLFDLFVYEKEKPEETQTANYIQRKWTRRDGDYYFLMSVSKENKEDSIEYSIGADKSVKLFKNGAECLKREGNKLFVSLKAGDVLVFKAFDDSHAVQSSFEHVENTVMTFYAPDNTERFLIATYKKENGVDELVRVACCSGTILAENITYPGEEYEVFIKAFAWDEDLRPIGETTVIPPKPR